MALARALCPRPSLLIADEPTGNLDETTGRAIIDMMFDLPARRGATLALVTHDSALACALRPGDPYALGKDRGDSAGRRVRMNAPAALTQARGRAPAARFALRDLRGGLAGLRIFLLCIALGVAAIVGVESLARALNDGMGREGRVILGGDASFSLIHRRLSADEQRFLEAHGSLSTIATVRGMARAASGDAALIEIKAVEPSWPRLGARGLRAAHVAR